MKRARFTDPWRGALLGALLVASAGLTGCKGCTPDLPDDDPNNDEDDDHQVVDSGVEDSGPVDTAPPPPCAVPEEEPNDAITDAQPIPLEEWACGTLLEQGDNDYFTFEIEEAGWYRIWVRGADIGSSSDLQMLLSDEDEDYTALSTSSAPDSLDPLLVFPAQDDRTFNVNISDQYAGYGSAYIWEMLITETKAPVGWDLEEIEPNDVLNDATPIEGGMRYFGLFSPRSDRDWYVITLPDGISTDLSFKIHAYDYGSPMLTSLRLHDPSGEEVKRRSNDLANDSEDAYLAHKTSEGGEWTLLVTNRSSSGGSDAYWYVLEVIAETSSAEE